MLNAMLIIQSQAGSHHHYITDGILSGAAATWVFSAFVSSMPPYNGSNYFWKWAYAFLHLIAANLDKVHVPGSAADIAAGAAAPPSSPPNAK